jgi:predicted extracellular nuclease
LAGLLCLAGPGTARALEIWQIQGTGMASPYRDQVVSADANVVTAVGPEGFFVQTPDARDDHDGETSNGVYVVTGQPPAVARGDLVDLSGRVAEVYDLTRIEDPDFTVVSSDHGLPAEVVFDALTPAPDQPWPANELERFEGMRVRIVGGVVCGPTDQYGDAWIVATDERVFREPGIQFPGEQGLPVWDGNPEAFEIDPDALGLDDVSLPAGTVLDAAGVLSYAFGDYQLWPTELLINSSPQLPRPVRAPRHREFTIATQNLYRLSRTDTDFADRLDKLSPYLRLVLGAPDVLAVQEVRDLETLTGLADRLADDDPEVVYTALLEEESTDINLGFLVRDTVRIVASYQIGTDATHSWDGSDLNDRPPYVLEAEYLGLDNPLRFTVVCVHQRSLSGVDDSEDGPWVRQKRHEQSVWLAHWIQDRQLADQEERLIVAGDFNAFEFTDGYVDVIGQLTGSPDPGGAKIPVEDIVDPALVDWVARLPADQRYSFVFGANAEVLDHAITNVAATRMVRGVQFARGNADAPRQLADDVGTTARSSDHDGLVLYLGPRWRPAGVRRRP